MAGLSRSPEPHGEVSNTMTHDGDVSLGHGMGSRSASPQIHDARHEPDRDERLQGLATRSWAELVDLASDRSRCEERLRNIRFNETDGTIERQWSRQAEAETEERIQRIDQEAGNSIFQLINQVSRQRPCQDAMLYRIEFRTETLALDTRIDEEDEKIEKLQNQIAELQGNQRETTNSISEIQKTLAWPVRVERNDKEIERMTQESEIPSQDRSNLSRQASPPIIDYSALAASHLRHPLPFPSVSFDAPQPPSPSPPQFHPYRDQVHRPQAFAQHHPPVHYSQDSAMMSYQSAQQGRQIQRSARHQTDPTMSMIPYGHRERASPMPGRDGDVTNPYEHQDPLHSYRPSRHDIPSQRPSVRTRGSDDANTNTQHKHRPGPRAILPASLQPSSSLQLSPGNTNNPHRGLFSPILWSQPYGKPLTADQGPNSEGSRPALKFESRQDQYPPSPSSPHPRTLPAPPLYGSFKFDFEEKPPSSELTFIVDRSPPPIVPLSSAAPPFQHSRQASPSVKVATTPPTLPIIVDLTSSPQSHSTSLPSGPGSDSVMPPFQYPGRTSRTSRVHSPFPSLSPSPYLRSPKRRISPTDVDHTSPSATSSIKVDDDSGEPMFTSSPRLKRTRRGTAVSADVESERVTSKTWPDDAAEMRWRMDDVKQRTIIPDDGTHTPTGADSPKLVKEE